eukprot:TRINITY_DN15905_c0_g1_i1.p1 TRINITY_DN15905_c0_g1~~TRINITY_DN15905_c0_g1_i1.p1  ORF type:complete len:572 (+),score=93.08 TRINITY_DN15905_c0_g1_i1:1218-2933(+)
MQSGEGEVGDGGGDPAGDDSRHGGFPNSATAVSATASVDDTVQASHDGEERESTILSRFESLSTYLRDSPAYSARDGTLQSQESGASSSQSSLSSGLTSEWNSSSLNSEPFPLASASVVSSSLYPQQGDVPGSGGGSVGELLSPTLHRHSTFEEWNAFDLNPDLEKLRKEEERSRIAKAEAAAAGSNHMRRGHSLELNSTSSRSNQASPTNSASPPLSPTSPHVVKPPRPFRKTPSAPKASSVHGSPTRGVTSSRVLHGSGGSSSLSVAVEIMQRRKGPNLPLSRATTSPAAVGVSAAFWDALLHDPPTHRASHSGSGSAGKSKARQAGNSDYDFGALHLVGRTSPEHQKAAGRAAAIAEAAAADAAAAAEELSLASDAAAEGMQDRGGGARAHSPPLPSNRRTWGKSHAYDPPDSLHPHCTSSSSFGLSTFQTGPEGGSSEGSARREGPDGEGCSSTDGAPLRLDDVWKILQAGKADELVMPTDEERKRSYQLYKTTSLNSQRSLKSSMRSTSGENMQPARLTRRVSWKDEAGYGALSESPSAVGPVRRTLSANEVEVGVAGAQPKREGR